MKRFTETNKWRDPWFRKLSGPAKMLWLYLYDNCDCVGWIEVDFGLVSEDCKTTITAEHMDELGDRVQKVTDNRYLLTKFIPFQYGELTKTCPAHKNVLKTLNTRGLIRVALGYAYPLGIPYPSPRVQEKVQVQDPVQEKGGVGEGDAALYQKIVDHLWKSYHKIPSLCQTSEQVDAIRQIMCRPEIREELPLVLLFKEKADRFPESVDSLLANWDRTVDRAKNSKPNGSLRPTDVVKAIDEAISAHPANHESMRHNPNCSPEQKLELRALRQKREEINRQIALGAIGK